MDPRTKNSLRPSVRLNMGRWEPPRDCGLYCAPLVAEILTWRANCETVSRAEVRRGEGTGGGEAEEEGRWRGRGGVQEGRKRNGGKGGKRMEGGARWEG